MSIRSYKVKGQGIPMAECMGVGDGGGERLQWGHAPPPQKNWGKNIFWAIIM